MSFRLIPNSMTLNDLERCNHHHHHQFNMHECSMNNKIHDKAHTIIQKDTKKDGYTN